jgi:hypothetical protein
MIKIISRSKSYTINNFDEVVVLIRKYVKNFNSITPTIVDGINDLLCSNKEVYSCFLCKMVNSLYRSGGGTLYKKDYWIIRGHSAEEAENNIKTLQTKNSYKLTKKYYDDNGIDCNLLRDKQSRGLNHFIEKYGDKDGKMRYELHCKRSKITVESMCEKYGYVVGKEKYDEYIKKQKESHSHHSMIEKHGEEKVNKMNSSRACKGSKNGMYGKPSPINTGRGMCGYYKNNYFRSSLEYFFMKKMEQEGKSYLCNDTAVKSNPSKITIPLGNGRNYIPDFIVGKVVVEVKAHWRVNATDVVEKRIAAEAWCKANGYSYVIVTEKDIPINKDVMKNDIDLLNLVILRNIKEYGVPHEDSSSKKD